MFSVALAVAAIPEALGSIVTIVQAIGTQKMAREQGIIKDLKAVESLGCVSVICTDKTGTLTQNRMAVEEIFCDFSAKVLGGQAKEALSEGEQWLWKAAVLANNASGEAGSLRSWRFYPAQKEPWVKGRITWQPVKASGAGICAKVSSPLIPGGNG